MLLNILRLGGSDEHKESKDKKRDLEWGEGVGDGGRDIEEGGRGRKSWREGKETVNLMSFCINMYTDLGRLKLVRRYSTH